MKGGRKLESGSEEPLVHTSFHYKVQRVRRLTHIAPGQTCRLWARLDKPLTG